MKKTMFLAAMFVAVSSLPAAVSAAPIAVHNTGVNGADVLVSPGAQASFWVLTTKPLAATEALGSNPFRYYNVAYFSDVSTAAWVSMDANGNASASGLYAYDLVIDLTGLDPATAFISGSFGTDNSGDISLNGNPPVASTASGDFVSPTAFTINSGFLPGLNTIRLRVANEGNPTAFFVAFDNASANPVNAVGVPVLAWPALGGLALLLAGLGSFLARRARPS